jgi:hypothetical protein
MSTPELHEFRLYRHGYSDPALKWPDNQLWADAITVLAEGSNSLDLRPRFGHAASWYRVVLAPAESAEDGWMSWRARLEIDSMHMGMVPLAWYVASPSDWPTGVARFPEVYGPRTTRTFPEPVGARGVWSLAVRRSQ